MLSSPLIQRLSERESELIGKLAENSATYGPKHPKILALRAEMADLRRKIRLEVRKIVNRVRGEVGVARAHEAALRQRLAELESKVAVSNQKGVGLQRLNARPRRTVRFLRTCLRATRRQRPSRAFKPRM